MAQFEGPRVKHPFALASFTFGGPLKDVQFSACRKKLHMSVNRVEIYFSKIYFVSFRVIHPLASFTFGVHCRMSLSLHAGKGMLHVSVNRVKIYFSKIGFVSCKWSNLIAPGSYTPWCHSLVGSTVGCPFLCMQEKVCCMWVSIEWKFSFQKEVLWAANGPIWLSQVHTPLGVIHFWGPL